MSSDSGLVSGHRLMPVHDERRRRTESPTLAKGSVRTPGKIGSVLLFLGAFTLSCCASASIPLTAAGAQIQIVPEGRIGEQCKFVQLVVSQQGANGQNFQHNTQLAVADTRNQAAALGASHVVLGAPQSDADRQTPAAVVNAIVNGVDARCVNCVRIASQAYQCRLSGTAAGSDRGERACVGGDGQACFDLGRANMRGDGTTQDWTEAGRYLDRSCALGSGRGCHFAAGLAAKGLGGPVDPGRASRLFRRACELGFARSCALVDEMARAEQR